MVIKMVNFLNTVNMGRLEETRAQSRTRNPAARNFIALEQKEKPELFGAGQSSYLVANIQQRQGENLGAKGKVK